jgi:branched-chain amino acid transport system substrate-binding protein
VDNVFRFTSRDDAPPTAIAVHLFRTLWKRRAEVIARRTTHGEGMSDEFRTSAFVDAGGEILLDTRN